MSADAMPDPLHERAYDAFDQGRLREAADAFAALAQAHPAHPPYAYMLGLAHKYLREWDASLGANRRALALREEVDEGAAWNAAIAATALGNWAQARELWALCGVRVPDGAGPIAMNGGLVGLRLNPWANPETLFAHRIDPARAYLRNVPLPRSGFRFDDLVLHDGAMQGERRVGDDVVPVFNALQRLERSRFDTFAVFATCPDSADVEALLATADDDVGRVEDWTASLRSLCLRCSYGTPHAHRESAPGEWNPERSLGIAAIDRAAVERLLAAWLAGGAGRAVDAVESGVDPLNEPREGAVWWNVGGDELS